MKKFLPYILIFLILVNFFTPFSVSINNKNKTLTVKNNVVNATGEYKVTLGGTIEVTDTTATVTVRGIENKDSNTADMTAGRTGVLNFDVFLLDENNIEIEDVKCKSSGVLPGSKCTQGAVQILLDDTSRTEKFVFSGLNPSTNYSVKIFIYEAFVNYTGGNFNKMAINPDPSSVYVIKTNTKDNKATTTVVSDLSVDLDTQKSPDGFATCNILGDNGGTFMGCVAQVFYYILFVPTSYIFALAGNLFDWTFAYSVSDSSYRSQFVTQGWGVIRDFCNIFFIFILLYVAFSTILDLKGPKAKEMIVNVIIIGFLINFSLFATQIIIDASNILARVFYNSDTIQITQKGANSVVENTSLLNTTKKDYTDGIIPLSAGIVNKINPQNLIINAQDIGSLGGVDSESTATKKDSISNTRFLIVTILSSAVNIVGFIVFFSVAFLFIGRVISLWLAMILSPLAFFSYMVPELKKQPSFGWTKWWDETISSAFVAPLFIFFMYIIIKFLETDLVFISQEGKTGLQLVIAVCVPFIFIMVLLLRAKKIAVKMSGEAGQAMSKIGSTIGGLALGTTIGAGAMAMRGTIGRGLGSIADNEKIKTKANEKGFGGFVARQQLKMGNYARTASFDVRTTKAAPIINKSLETNLGKGKVGGYQGYEKKQVEKQMKSAELTKSTEAVASEQDKKAKEWSKSFEDEKLKIWKSDPSRAGHAYDESKLNSTEKAIIAALKDKKVKTSKEIDQEKMAKRAETVKTGGPFTPGVMLNSNMRDNVVSQLEKKSKTEKEELSPLKKYNLEIKKAEAKKIIEESTGELSKIDLDLTSIADELRNLSNKKDSQGNPLLKDKNGNPIIINKTANDLTKEDIKVLSEYKQADLDINKTKLSKLNSDYKKPTSPEIEKHRSSMKALQDSIDGKGRNANTDKYETEIVKIEAIIKQNPENIQAINDLNTAKGSLRAEKDRIKMQANNTLTQIRTDLEKEEEKERTRIKDEITATQIEIREKQAEISKNNNIFEDKRKYKTIIQRQDSIVEDASVKLN